MSMMIIDIASWMFLCIGSAFCLIGGIGLLRMPNFYTRCHAAGVTDSGGAGFMLVGLMLQAGFGLVFFKLLTVLLFLWLTSPAATHALAKAAYARGHKAE
jgi:multicomponent Na+:H+ antiporter subunit G